MHTTVFVQSVWIGLGIAAPVGPIGWLVIQRTLRHGVPVGLATGLGAALADACYGAVGAYGVAVLIHGLQQLRLPLALLGGAFLFWLAWRTWQTAGHEQGGSADAPAGRPASPALWACLAGTFLLTLSNPATILSFVAIFGAMAGQGAPVAPAVMVLGVLLGSALWWLVLCSLVGTGRSRVGPGVQTAVGRVSALMLAAFALWQWLALGRA